MNARPFFLLALAALLLSSSGCLTTHHRAREHSAAFGKLSRDDQRLVLHRRVRTGMSKEAVYIAWGRPGRTFDNGKSKSAQETWIYERQVTVYAPMGSYDQAPFPPSGMYGLASGYGIPPGIGFGGVPNTGFPYPPRINIADVIIKRARFVDGRLISYETRRGGRQVDAGGR